ncbi:MAG TPA: metallophosphoesterase [Oculatellaceae cyanobacterium]
MHIAAVGDLHCKKNSQGMLAPLFKSISSCADVVALCGDLTDYGTADEANVLTKELAPILNLPVVAVLGNHDYESDNQEEVKRILTESGITILDGEAVEINGVGFAGAKGFAGGFGKAMLGAWGEQTIKHFVQEALNESLKLEAALARLRTQDKVVLLHYAPIVGTVLGEPPEIYSFLGTSRLEEPINRHGATIVFHGHAHSGSPHGQTSIGIPVHNVAHPLFKRRFENHPGFGLFEIGENGASNKQAEEPKALPAAPKVTPAVG